jgi:aminopeptidase N
MRFLTNVIATLMAVAVVSGTTFGSQIWVGPTDSDGHIYKTPPSAEQMQKMIAERDSLHACKQKSVALNEKIKAARSPLVVAYPTSNMYDYDVLYYQIDIEIDMGAETVDGYVDMQCKSLVNGLSYVDMTLTTGMSVTEVDLNSSAQTFSHATEVLTVNFDQTLDTDDEFTVRVYYNGTPTYSNLDGMDFYTAFSRKVCYTNCEPFGARNWWPCKDFPFDKADNGVDVIITHPTTYGGYTMDLVSNGVLQSVTNVGGGLTETHWKEFHPISTYLVALVLTDFNKTVQNWEYSPGNFMPVEQNYYPSAPPSATWSSTWYMVNYTIPSLDALSYFFGLYPFYDEKYGHMHYGWNGAMEHQTTTSISPYFNSEYVIAHELGHQWAGDNVTCKTFNHIWLNEGFASYCEVLYFEYTYGWPTAKSWLMGQRHINAGTPYVENIETQDIFDGVTVYDKGSWLVHMLRNQMGDDLFFPAMQDYFHTSAFAGKSADTDDLNSVCSQYYGSDMSWFFDAWVYQEGQPNYVYSYTSEESEKAAGYNVLFFLDQNNVDGVFPMNVDIVAYAGGFDSTYTIWNAGPELYEFNFPNPPDSFKIDPEDKILKTVSEEAWSMHIAVASIPDAVLGEPYSFTFTAVGGVPDYTWEKILGQYPYGLSMNEATGELSGTPGWVAEYFFELRCTDSDDPPNVEERGFSMRVVEPGIDRGDVDDSGNIDVDDAVFLIQYIFAAGPAPDPLEKGDVDCSGGVDIDDVVYLVTYIFGSGPEPC